MVAKVFEVKKKKKNLKMGTYYLTSKSQLGDNSSLSDPLQPPVILPLGSLAKCEAYCVFRLSCHPFHVQTQLKPHSDPVK